mgnify:CR=1 FL=1
MANPLADLLAHQSVVILDGGLASTLEGHGHDLDDGLRSGILVREEVERVPLWAEARARAAELELVADFQAGMLAQVDKILDGPLGEVILKDLEGVGFKGLAFSENGFRNLTNNTRTVTTPDDIKGLRLIN